MHYNATCSKIAHLARMASVR